MRLTVLPSLFLLAPLLICTTACDDTNDFGQPHEVAVRGGGGLGTIFNTPFFGSHAIPNFPKSFGLEVSNSDAGITFISGTITHGEEVRDILFWRILDDGELNLFYRDSVGQLIKLEGEDVAGANFTIEVTPNNETLFQTGFIITAANCSEFPACAYKLVTPLPNPNPDDYPDELFDHQTVYPLCSGTNYADELGLYLDWAFFQRNIYTDKTNFDFPLKATSSADSVHCVAGSLGKIRSQAALDATYFFPGNQHPRVLDDEVQNNAMVAAISGKIGAEHHTVPGAELCIVDTMSSLFGTEQDCANQGFSRLEGIYGASDDPNIGSGMRCRPATFVHRIASNITELGNDYQQLPMCPSDLVTGLANDATIAVFVEP